MALFSNQATLTYRGNTTNSNIAYGELLDAVAASKTAVEGSYAPGDVITYVVTLRNTGTTQLNALTVTDDLGAYTLNGATVYPLTYENGTATLFVNGQLQPAPAVTVGPPLVLDGINLPGNSDAVIVYQARVNSFANPAADGTIVNTVTVTGEGINTPVTATETISAKSAAQLTITKSISPAQVVDNERVTYTFVIQNYGNQPVVATDNAAITDTFDPILSALSVTYNGTAWTEGTEYNYNETTGVFSTVPSAITVPAATYSQDPITGEYTLTPGTATLTVTGTI